jgi:hypothetical protein
MSEKKPKIYITCDKISIEEMAARISEVEDIVAEYGEFKIDDAIEVRLHPEGHEIALEMALMTDGTP